ncbi:hypothetical protein MRX96_024739 [Rhipicephalus microplus]
MQLKVNKVSLVARRASQSLLHGPGAGSWSTVCGYQLTFFHVQDITVTKPYVIPVSHVQRDPRSRDTSKRRVGLSHFVLTEKTLDPTLDDGDLTTRPTEITTRRTAT